MAAPWTSNGRMTGAIKKLYILQARPETVHSRVGRVVQRFTLRGRSKVITEGRSIGGRIGSGRARVIRDATGMAQVQAGDVLVADMTDPDWEPVMKRAAAIVTNRGGRTCHAAIIARELGVPAVVGCGNATQLIRDGQEITVSCAEGDTGYIYEGLLDFEQQQIAHDTMPGGAGADHDERRQSRPCLCLCRPAAPGRWSGATGIHHQSHDRRASARAARVREPGSGRQADHPPAHRGLCRSGELLCRSPERRRGADRRRLCAGAGDRAALRLQVERIRESYRRSALRAARGESDARIPRCRPLRG